MLLLLLIAVYYVDIIDRAQAGRTGYSHSAVQYL